MLLFRLLGFTRKERERERRKGGKRGGESSPLAEFGNRLN